MAEATLDGKVLVITGGTRGIGEQLVRQGAEAGANVIFSYNTNKDKAKELEGELGARSLYLKLGDDESTGYFLRTVHNLGDIDYFIANAGMEFSGDVGKHNWEVIRDVINANLTGNAFLLQRLIYDGLMVKCGEISVIGSIAADGNHDQMAYSAAKAGLRGLVGSLQYDKKVQEHDLSIRLIEPAFVRTDMTDKILRILERRVIKAKGGDELVEEFRDSGLVMDVDYAAREILRLTAHPSVEGRITIPSGIHMQEVRSKYF